MPAADPFGTAGVRSRVLAAWAAAPERFREDANAEEDLALGGHRDRLVVELAQNAADAARAAGVPGRLLLRLADGVLTAANTGAALDAAGVLALSTLRASAKREGGTTGRFGVGFAAVLAVSDAPSVVGRGTGVRFDRERSAALVAGQPGDALRAELDRRGGHVPVLRLPWPASGRAPSGYDTAVVLPLRDAAAAELAAALLEDVGDALLLSLPALAEVVVELPGRPARRVVDVPARWRTRSRSGSHHPDALADRPTEERARPGWALTWAVPRTPGRDTAVPRVVHAPTPTDEPMAWPALLVSDLPLDPTRRHVAPGPATAAVTAEAAAAYADLLGELAAEGRDVLPLVPTGLPAGALDAALREATLPRLRSAPLLLPVDGGAPVPPRHAVALTGPGGDDPGVLAVLAPLLAGLVAAPRAGEPALRVLDVRRVELAEVVEALPAAGGPEVWASRYAALAPLAVEASAREALAMLPVPLADGRVVRGVRGVLLPAETVAGPAGDALAVLAEHGLRVVHPAAGALPGAADLLERLGAVPASATAVLDSAALRSAVRASADEPGPELAAAVLSVVAAAWQQRPWRPGERGWLSELALPDADGDPTPAGLLVQPGSPAQDVLDPGSVGVLDADVAAAWPPEVLQAVGVAGVPVLVRCADVDPADLPAELDELDGAARWGDEVSRRAGDGSVRAAEVVAVRDLDLVREDAWPQVLRLLATDPELRRAVTAPVVLEGAGERAVHPSYTAWWLRDELGLAGSVVTGGAGADPAPWARLLPSAPPWAAALDGGMRAALGIVASPQDLGADGWLRLLGRLGLDGEAPTVELLLQVWAHVAGAAEVLLDARDGEPLAAGPAWALAAGPVPAAVLAAPGAAVVVDAPQWLQRGDLGPLVVAPAGAGPALADLLDLDLAAERAPGRVTSTGVRSAVPDAVRRVLPGAGGTWVEHDDLRVDGVRVDWWVSGADGRPAEPGGPARGPQEAVAHACTADGLARALAAAAGRWGERYVLEAVLLGAVDPATALVERAVG